MSDWMTIGKRFHFSSAHQLNVVNWTTAKNAKVFGKCHRLHGHNYVMTVEVGGYPNEESMVVNYYQLTDLVDPLVNHWDHQFLNDLEVFRGKLTTAENMVLVARDYLEALPWPKGVYLESVTIQETEKTFARWHR